MADLAGRIKQVERKLNFIMDNMRMRAALQTGILGSDGKPVIKLFEGSLNELYAMSREIPTEGANGVEELLKAASEGAVAVSKPDDDVDLENEIDYPENES